MDLDPRAIPADVLALLPEEICRKHRLLPVDRIEGSLVVAMANPSDVFALDDVRFLTGYDVVPVASTEAALAAALDLVPWPAPAGAKASDADLDGNEVPAEVASDSGGESPVVTIVNGLLADALRLEASAVHVVPGESGVHVAYRVGDTLQKTQVLPAKLRDPITSRLKIMAKLDIADRRLPQDGRMKVRAPGKEPCDVMVATLPTVQGERIIMRFEQAGQQPRTLDDLGLASSDLERLKRLLRDVSGVGLVAGPARSGRTTSLYAIVRSLNDGTRAIVTIENRVTQRIDGVAQAEARDAIGYTTAVALHASMRHDPDVIVCDAPALDDATAALMAAASERAAVYASISAAGAAEAVAAFALLTGAPAAAARLRFVIAQKLVRRRLAVEIMECTPALRKAIAGGADAAELRRIATLEGMTPLED